MPPAKPKFVVYYRVSTQKQGRSGLGLEAQQAAAHAYLQAHGGIELASFTEIESGKVDSRPKLEAALLRCKQSRATLLVAKLDRLSRNISFLFRMRDQGVKFQALDIPEANTLTLGVFAAMAQHEREIISARTKAALAARRARGLPLGTPRDLSAYARTASAAGRVTNRAKALARAEDIRPQINAAREAGHLSLRAIAAYLNQMQIPTPRGKSWTATAVANAHRMIDTAAKQSA
jgi:DNA invertase Pin-like site-specific DNA recombinase